MGKSGCVRTCVSGKWILPGIACCIFVTFGGASFVQPVAAQNPSTAQYPSYPSETPNQFEPVTDSFDYVRRDVMIPMRDGVKLHTVILVPEGREGRADPADAHALQRRPSSPATRAERAPRARS